ncbi:MAG: methionine ABC transporter permease, partial [Lachnospiraceae bacterium]|nr:methionine ABC transporter permease [Lachnospiraceae bacterium]MDY2760230.1 methionine ABC transporter permease [Lachnospiraceae bacterium]
MSATEIQMIIKGIGETLYMTIISTLIGYVIGLPWGIGLTVTNKDGIHPNTVVFRILDILAN